MGMIHVHKKRTAALHGAHALLALALLLMLPASAFAIGEFSLGMNLGFTYGPNGVDDTVNRFNTGMENYKSANAGTKMEQLSAPYCPVFGVSARYQFNYFLFRFGWHYTQPVLPIEGYITPVGGVKNKIRITTYQNSLPATIGIIMPLKKRTYFYLGAGGTLHHAYIKVTQKAPNQPTATPAFNMTSVGVSDNQVDRYSGMFVAYHLILGAEVPVSEKVTITTEWIHQEGMSYPLKNQGLDNGGAATADPKRNINVRGDVLLFGVSYYIHI
jgi:hypothetical protein